MKVRCSKHRKYQSSSSLQELSTRLCWIIHTFHCLPSCCKQNGWCFSTTRFKPRSWTLQLHSLASCHTQVFCKVFVCLWAEMWAECLTQHTLHHCWVRDAPLVELVDGLCWNLVQNSCLITINLHKSFYIYIYSILWDSSVTSGNFIKWLSSQRLRPIRGGIEGQPD